MSNYDDTCGICGYFVGYMPETAPCPQCGTDPDDLPKEKEAPMPKYEPTVDPECPEVKERVDTLVEDPMTLDYGAPVGEIVAKFASKHVTECVRCREYSNDANMP